MYCLLPLLDVLLYIKPPCSNVDIVVSGPVTINGNEARSSGGAIYSAATTVTFPADVDFSDNTAIFVSLGFVFLVID